MASVSAAGTDAMATPAAGQGALQAPPRLCIVFPFTSRASRRRGDLAAWRHWCKEQGIRLVILQPATLDVVAAADELAAEEGVPGGAVGVLMRGLLAPGAGSARNAQVAAILALEAGMDDRAAPPATTPEQRQSLAFSLAVEVAQLPDSVKVLLDEEAIAAARGPAITSAHNPHCRPSSVLAPAASAGTWAGGLCRRRQDARAQRR